ncbi:MAG: redoxin domain-containing protein [Deltaproteobacteria bacterium]
MKAPDINHPGLRWFNTASPLSLEDLRGRVVILDFWTFCCINCMHILPMLALVEKEFASSVTVIGVHSPKFSAERDPANLAKAIARYGIEHPVVNDPDMGIWRSYGVRAWPTLVFISPGGEIVGHHSGEPSPEGLLGAVGELVERGRGENTLVPGALEFDRDDEAGGAFLFPGKLRPGPAYDGVEKTWVLADGGHNQIVLLDDDGCELTRFGQGGRGFRDGHTDEALFNNPQGLVAGAGKVYVADTQNHAIRCIDPAAQTVVTVAGTGQRGPLLGRGTDALQTALASPWDLEFQTNSLYFANAGSHQLGCLDLDTLTVSALAGSSAEDIVDGPAEGAQLAQPSGLQLTPAGLYFVDSETSALRVLEMGEHPRVTTLIGSGLFDFGHTNGPFQEASLQHPLGVTVLGGRLLVADSYNGALRIVDLEAGRVDDLDDGSFVCHDPTCIPLAEPAAVAGDGDKRVLVVDTNNHRILEYDLAGRSYHTWAGARD